MYIKNPFGFFPYGDIWVKAVKGEGNTYEVRMPRLYTTTKVTSRIQFSTLGATSRTARAAKTTPLLTPLRRSLSSSCATTRS
ncbi:MAG: hypothetical protein SPE71_00325 [Prevotella sp.]|uniref:hypothetical protein n=1 Tax=Leyella stercorea TaxID=363265 RepID=UPI002800C0FD|nr:hypothetical protein [Leyella stercorea]MDY4198495.1 hypothetical protein [Prevotella sp.]MDY5078689.1 hypothetical protein [Prevotella sp.]MDY5300186.1 hypothetical protein [Prevotella sp.]